MRLIIFYYLNFITMVRVLCFLIVISFLGFGSCKKKATDPDYCNTAWATQVQTELTTLSNALSVYTADPTPANCNSYKAAYQNYIDALEPFGNCSLWTAQQKSDGEDAIAEAQADIATLCQ
jgi:hypothetical protein